MLDLLIVGSGPVGLYSAFLAGAKKLKTEVIESLGYVGGQLTTLYPEKPIYDVPGIQEIKAKDLIKELYSIIVKYLPKLLDMFESLTDVRNQSYVTYKMKTICVTRLFGLLCGLTTMTDISSDDFNSDNCIKNLSNICNQDLEELPYWETIQDVFMKIKTDELSLFDEEILPFTGGIRGEVIMSHEVHQKYFSDKANCRNAANGLMKRKDGEGSEHLQIICYDAFFTDTSSYDYPFKDEVEKMKWLEKIGFTTSPLQICKTPQDVIDYRASVMETRKSIPYDIDGLVIKGKKIDLIDAQRNRPEKQIAFKQNWKNV